MKWIPYMEIFYNRVAMQLPHLFKSRNILWGKHKYIFGIFRTIPFPTVFGFFSAFFPFLPDSKFTLEFKLDFSWKIMCFFLHIFLAVKYYVCKINARHHIAIILSEKDKYCCLSTKIEPEPRQRRIPFRVLTTKREICVNVDLWMLFASYLAVLEIKTNSLCKIFSIFLNFFFGLFIVKKRDKIMTDDAWQWIQPEAI